MRTLSVMLAIAALWCMPLGAEEREEDAERAILQELRRLRESVEELSDQISALAEKLEEEEEAETDVALPPGLGAPEEHRGPDMEALGEIKLPDDPTREEAEHYISHILEVSQRQNWFSNTDPQGPMLIAVGRENVDLLLDALLANRRLMGSMYLLGAINRLAGEEHKGSIIESLLYEPELVEVVVDHGWVQDAREELMHGLQEGYHHLPVEWVRAVASFEDPASYPPLKKQLIHGDDPRGIYEAIRNLPGIELEEAVAETWERARYQRRWVKREAAEVAVRYGHVDALGYLIRALAP
ncbi:MAG: hypothetical protein PVJ27_10210, partial [Candidatus Brocadiaceae bacterium]